MEEFLKILSLILISSVKFAFGIPFVYMTEEYDFTWLETNIYAISGGMLGVVFFMYFSDWLMRAWATIRNYFFIRKERITQLFSPPVADVEEQLEIHYDYVEKSAPVKKIFTPRTRRIVRLWTRYGLIGLAVLTPIILSIPIGTFFMTRLEKNKKRILFFMIISITCWSLLLTSIFQFTNARSLEELF